MTAFSALGSYLKVKSSLVDVKHIRFFGVLFNRLFYALGLRKFILLGSCKNILQHGQTEAHVLSR